MTLLRPVSGRSLRRSEAESRRALLAVSSYDVELDLSGAEHHDAQTFGSRTTVTFESQGGETFVDLKPVQLETAVLDGTRLDPATLREGRLPLATSAGTHVLEVVARMGLRNDGEGLHRSIDPADGRVYLYAMSFMDAAPSIFACFDQPDLKAPYRVQVIAPDSWTVIGNGAAHQLEAGRWVLAPTEPLSTYFVTLVAGPYHLIRDHHDGIALGLSARLSLREALEREAEELFTLTRQSFDELHRLFGIRYSFGGYHQAFVPEFNAGAMENPGCVTFRDQMVFEDRVTRSARIDRATTVAHEMAHQWFGNLVTPRWWDDLWLNESFAEYLGTRVTAEVTAYDDAWARASASRRQWGLAADQRPSTHPVAGNGAQDAVSALQDFDGISYVKGSAVLKQLVALVGDEVFFGGVVEHLTRHRFGNAAMADLVAAWERAGAADLGGFTDAWLRTAGLDTLLLDRAAGSLTRLAPGQTGALSGHGDPVARDHALTVAVARLGGWRTERLQVRTASTPVEVGEAAVVIDATEQTWAAGCADAITLAALPALLAAVQDPMLHAGAWNNVRSGFRAASLDPAAVVDLVVASPDLADLGDTGTRVTPWTVGTLLALAPPGSGRRVHESLIAALDVAGAGTDQQLQALRGAVHTAEDPAVLRGWLAGELPPGADLDQDLRWRLLARLAALGGADRDELDRALSADPSTTAGIEHTRAVASLPDPSAKEFAWDRFTGAVEVANHEIEAAGTGMWQLGQQHLTAPFVERYAADLPRTAEIRSGWVLALSAESFFPVTHIDEPTLATVQALAEVPELPAAVRRRVLDATDDLVRRLAVARAFAHHDASSGSTP